MRRSHFWLVVVLMLLGGCIVASWKQFTVQKIGDVATVSLAGRCIQTVDLGRVEEIYTFTISGKSGSNTIVVEPGRIRIVSADCPRKLCVQQGWLSPGGLPLVCLPHKLVISVEGSTDVSVDHVSQ